MSLGAMNLVFTVEGVPSRTISGTKFTYNACPLVYTKQKI